MLAAVLAVTVAMSNARDRLVDNEAVPANAIDAIGRNPRLAFRAAFFPGAELGAIRLGLLPGFRFFLCHQLEFAGPVCLNHGTLGVDAATGIRWLAANRTFLAVRFDQNGRRLLFTHAFQFALSLCEQWGKPAGTGSASRSSFRHPDPFLQVLTHDAGIRLERFMTRQQSSKQVKAPCCTFEPAILGPANGSNR